MSSTGDGRLSTSDTVLSAASPFASFVRGAYAQQQRPIKMTFSGTMIPTSIDVKPDTITDEELLAGNGTLGNFTFRKLRTDATAPESFGGCGNGSGPTIRVTTGAGVFRFEDGSLLTVTVTDGTLCVDFDHLVGHLTESYQITRGTGHLTGASGVLHLNGTLKPVLFSDSGAAVFLTNTGTFEGTIDTDRRAEAEPSSALRR